MLDKKRTAKPKPAPGLVPGVTYSRGSMGDSKAARAESIPIAGWFTVSHMTGFANVLFVVAGLIGLFAAFQWVSRVSLFQLRHAYVNTPLRHIDEVVLRSVIHSLHGDFLNVNLAEAQAKIAKLSWVRRVDIRREFPDRLYFAIEEHEPLARWAEDTMVNVYGELFNAEHGGVMPTFSGPEGREKEVVEFYQRSKATLAVLGLAPVGVTLSPRHAWRLNLDNGLILELGRDQIDQRLAVFTKAYRHTFAHMPDARGTVDLRYNGGFALKSNFGGGLLKKESTQGNKG